MDADPHAPFFDVAEPAVGARLRAIAVEVRRRLPDAEPCVGYGMPAFRRKRVFFYFGAFRRHIGVYPPVDGPPDLVAALGPYRGPKGNLSFPHGDPLPVDLVGRVAERLALRYGA